MKEKKTPGKDLVATIKRPTFKDFKKEVLKDAEVKAEYDTLAPLFDTKKQFINRNV